MQESSAAHVGLQRLAPDSWASRWYIGLHLCAKSAVLMWLVTTDVIGNGARFQFAYDIVELCLLPVFE